MKQIVPAFRSPLPDSMRAGMIKPSHWNSPLKYLSDGTGPDGVVLEVLTANRDYYVRADGSNSNDGLANVSTRAFQTIQRAIDEIANLNVNGFDVTINVSDGTYVIPPSGLDNAGIVLKGYRGETASQHGVAIVGNTTTPSNVIIGTGDDYVNDLIVSDCQVPWKITGVKLQQFNGLALITARALAVIYVGKVDFAVSGSYQLQAIYGGRIRCLENFSASGSSAGFATAWFGGSIFLASYPGYAAITITITGTPNFTAFAIANGGGLVESFNVTFSGSATGSRYSAVENGVIQTYGGGANYFPGNAAGSTANGGLYE